MKELKIDKKRGHIKLKVDTEEDLWYLSEFIRPGDVVGKKTVRKLKLNIGETTESDKKPMYLKIQIEKSKFHEYTGNLRLTGPIIEGPEDVKGSHSFTVKPATILDVWKDKLSQPELDLLKEAKIKRPKLLIVLTDRENAIIALAGKRINIRSRLPPKDEPEYEAGLNKFFSEIYQKLAEQNYDALVIAGPGFAKDKLSKFLKNKGVSSFVEPAASVTESGLREVLAKAENEVITKTREAEETRAIDELFKRISKNKGVAYGKADVEKAIEQGKIEKMLVSSAVLRGSAQKGNYAEIRDLMEKVKYMGATLLIVGRNKDAQERLDGLGGIAALCRW
ncbi:MAG: pelota family protein [Candidatus Altiarchaeota archaeon]|nr:pelota family protein [Candidatus Altiarchaeota archaeon]